MATQVKMTFTGGGNLGEDHVLDLDRPRILGRTRVADVVVSKTDIEVSGRHLEFRAEGSGASVVCLSRNGFELNGVKVTEGESRPIAKGDEIRLGRSVRIRIDRVGAGASARGAAAPEGRTYETRATGNATFATRAVGSTTFAATSASMRVGPEEPSFGGSIVETPVGENASVATRLTMPVALTDDAVTVQDTTTGDAVDPLSVSDAESVSGGTLDGETQAMATRVGNMDVIHAIAEEKQRVRRFKQRLLTVAAFGALAVLGVLVYWRWPRAERWLQHPQPIAQHFVKLPTGAIRFFVDYPSQARTRLSERSNGGVDVETLTGKSRDVPLRLSLDIRRHVSELDLSLDESAAREVAALRRQGYAFEPTGSDGGFGFFERDYPLSCENGGAGCGVRFYRREFTRSDGTGQWHGVLIYFRDTDTAYRLLREIPEPEWPRGLWLLREDPNLALYAGFLRTQWESPGSAAVAGFSQRPVADLLKRIDAAIERNIPSEWKETGRMIDALMLVGLKGKADVLSEARARLNKLRTAKDLFYEECESRRDCGFAKEAFAKAWGAFGDDAGDVRSCWLSDPSKWRRE